MNFDGERRGNMSLKLYDELAAWWPLLSPPEEYAEEAALYIRALKEQNAYARTCLELGAGGGNNASFMKAAFAMTLTDPSEGMLAHSRRLNPECEHLVGDMRTLRLGRTFDAVFVHDAVCYMTTLKDLRAAVATASVHCNPGGAALFCPDYVAERFRPGTEHDGADAADGRGVRYLEWHWDPDPTDTQYLVDYACMLREADGSVRVEHDRHVEGLFARSVWLQVLAEAGFEPRALAVEYGGVALGPHEMFVCRKLAP